jgi:hypothetical protein
MNSHARQHHLGKAEKAAVLARLHAPGDPPGTWTYIATRDAEILAAQFTMAETLPWDTLPGTRKLIGDRFKYRDPAKRRHAFTFIGTSEGRAWVTWHLPCDPPPVPSGTAKAGT